MAAATTSWELLSAACTSLSAAAVTAPPGAATLPDGPALAEYAGGAKLPVLAALGGGAVVELFSSAIML